MTSASGDCISCSCQDWRRCRRSCQDYALSRNILSKPARACGASYILSKGRTNCVRPNQKRPHQLVSLEAVGGCGGHPYIGLDTAENGRSPCSRAMKTSSKLPRTGGVKGAMLH